MKITQSISFKLIISALIVITTLVLISSIDDYINQSVLLKNKQTNYLKLAASRLQLNLPPAIWDYDEEHMESILNSEQQSDNIAYIEIFNVAGELLSKSTGQKNNDPIEFQLEYIDDDESTNVGKATLFINSSAIDSELSSLTFRLILKALLLDLFLLLALHFLVRKLVSKPLTEVANALENIARGEGDLTQRLTLKSADEMEWSRAPLIFSWKRYKHWSNLFNNRFSKLRSPLKMSILHLRRRKVF